MQKIKMRLSKMVYPAKVLVALLIIYALVKYDKLDFNIFKELEVNLQGFIWVFILQVLMLFLPIVRWYILVAAKRREISFYHITSINMIGYFATIFVPAGLGIEFSRIYYMNKYYPQFQKDVISSLFVDRLLGLGALLFIALIASGVYLCTAFNQVISNIFVYFLSIFFLGILFFVIVLRKKAISYIKFWTQKHRFVFQLLQSFYAYKELKIVLTTSFFLSILGHLCNILSAFLVFWMLPERFVKPNLVEVLVFTPIVNLSGVIPLTPLGLGISEVVAVQLYESLHIEGAALVTMFMRLITILLSLGGVFFYLTPFKKSKYE